MLVISPFCNYNLISHKTPQGIHLSPFEDFKAVKTQGQAFPEFLSTLHPEHSGALHAKDPTTLNSWVLQSTWEMAPETPVSNNITQALYSPPYWLTRNEVNHISCNWRYFPVSRRGLMKVSLVSEQIPPYQGKRDTQYLKYSILVNTAKTYSFVLCLFLIYLLVLCKLLISQGLTSLRALRSLKSMISNDAKIQGLE